MAGYFSELGEAARRWPLYMGLLLVVVLAFGWGAFGGYRLLGDNRETDGADAANSLAPGARGGGHGSAGHGYSRYYHK